MFCWMMLNLQNNNIDPYVGTKRSTKRIVIARQVGIKHRSSCQEWTHVRFDEEKIICVNDSIRLHERKHESDRHP